MHRNSLAAELFVPALTVLLFVGGGMGCGNDNGVGAGAATLVETGWNQFEDNQFEEALRSFESALEKDANYGDAHSGAGWTQARLGDLHASREAFDRALTTTPTSLTDVYAGRSIVMLDTPPVDYAATETAARSVIDADSLYTFLHDPTVNWRDMRLIIALCLFAQTEYVEANREIARVGGIPQDSTSTRFVPDLLEELERLSRRLSGRP